MNSMFCFHGSFHLAYVFIVNPQLLRFVSLAGQYSLLCSGKAFSIAQEYLPSPGVSCPTREKYFLKPRYFRELYMDVIVLRFVIQLHYLVHLSFKQNLPALQSSSVCDQLLSNTIINCFSIPFSISVNSFSCFSTSTPLLP